MQVSVDISLQNIINLISQMSLSEIEEIKNNLIDKELYLQKFKKDNIENIVEDFEKEGYSKKFLEELEDGLRKSSIYNAD